MPKKKVEIKEKQNNFAKAKYISANKYKFKKLPFFSKEPQK